MKDFGMQYFVSASLMITMALTGAPRAGHAAQEVVGWGNDYYGQTTVPDGLSNVVAIAAGDTFSLALTADGRVTAWGKYNTGWGTYVPMPVPSGLSNVVGIAAGNYHGLALTDGGQVVAWGQYNAGSTSVPMTPPSGLSNVVAVAAAGGQSLALTAEGVVVGWGDDDFGRKTVPRGLSNVVAIAAGGSHNLALTGDGQVVAWGGYMDNTNWVPMTVPSGLSNVVAVSAEEDDDLALTAEGRVVAWGDNRRGQTNVPSGLSNVVAIAAGGPHNLAVTADGQVVAWGDYWNISGYVPDNAPNGLSNVVAVAARQFHSLALRGWAPGLAAPLHLGPRFLLTEVDQPFQHRIMAKNGVTAYGVSGLPARLTLDPVTGVITGRPAQAGKYDLVLSATNGVGYDSWPVTLWVNAAAAPGIESSGFMQTGLGLAFNLPVIAHNGPASFGASGLPAGLVIDAQTGIISGTPLEAGDFTVGLVASNRYGSGTGSVTIRVSPLVVWPSKMPGGLSNVVAIAGGDRALTADGRLMSWPDDGNWQTAVSSGLSNVVAITAGAFALTADGHVVPWGGASPDGVFNALSNVTAIAAGGYHGLALTAQGQGVAWGDNSYGQTNIPSGLRNVVAIAAGYTHSLALTADGRVVAWGSNQYGQTSVPSNLSNVVAVAAGSYHSLALRADGQMVAWGKYVDPSGRTIPPASAPAALGDVVAIAAGLNCNLALTAQGRVVEWGLYGDGQPNGLSNVVAIAVQGGDKYFGENVRAALVGLPPGIAAPALIGPRFLMAVADHAFYHRIIAKNGVGTYGASGLPPGLVLDDRTGLVSGQPTQAGRYDVVLSATNRLGSDSWTVTLYVNPSAAPAIESSGVQKIGLGINFEFPVVALNAPNWYGASGLPAGLVIDPQTGLISGVPVEFGDFAVSLEVTNRYGRGTGSLTLRVSPLVELGRSAPSQTDIPSGLSNVVGLASSGYYGPYSLALTAEGRAVFWGTDTSGQLSVPGGLSNVVGTAAGPFHILALTAQGQVAAWGTGDATNVPPGLSNVVALAAGGFHSLALTAEGRVVAWGRNTDLVGAWGGQTNVPTWLSNVVGIAAGDFYSLALTAEGRVAAWGGRSATNVPNGLTNVVAIAAAGSDSLALTVDGRVVGWGYTPVPSGLSNVIAIAAGGIELGMDGSFQGLALTAEGRVVQWGWHESSFNRYPSTPVPANLSNVVGIAAGGYVGLALTGLPPGLAAPGWFGPRFLVSTLDRPFQHRIRVSNGADAYGADGLPPGLTLDSRTGLITGRPARPGHYDVRLSATNRVGSCNWMVTFFVNGFAAAPGIASGKVAPATLGFDFSYAVDAHNAPDWFGATGLPAGLAIDARTGVISGTPAETGEFVVSLVASNRFGEGLGVLTLEISPVVAWGADYIGQTTLPNGLSNVVAIAGGSDRSLALTAEGRVIAWGGMPPPSGLSNVVGIAVGDTHSLALTARGQVLAWGMDRSGETVVPGGLSNVVAIAAGRQYSLALTAAGRVVAWGDDLFGQAEVPSGLSNVVAIAAGDYHNLALTDAGRVIAWGSNGSGECNVPGGLTNVVAITAGGSHSLALTAAGRVVAWGDDQYGQTDVPSGLSNVVAMAAGSFFSLALTAEGQVVGWGDNSWAQLNVPSGLSNVVAIATGWAHCLALIRQPTVPIPQLHFLSQVSGSQLQAQGAPGISCLLLRASRLSGPWLPAEPVTFTNTVQILRPPNTSEPVQFFRLLRK